MLEKQTQDDLIKWATRLNGCKEEITKLLAIMLNHGEKTVSINTVKAEACLSYLETWSKDNILKFERNRAKKVSKKKREEIRQNSSVKE